MQSSQNGPSRNGHVPGKFAPATVVSAPHAARGPHVTASQPSHRDRGASALALIDREASEINRLADEMRVGVRSQRHYDDLEERAQGIARRIRAAFRGAVIRPAGATTR